MTDDKAPGWSPDNNYDLVNYSVPKRGQQCGKCGNKFDYNTRYGFTCPDYDCPMQPKYFMLEKYPP